MNLELVNERRNNSIYTDGNNTYKIFNKNYKLLFLQHIGIIVKIFVIY